MAEYIDKQAFLKNLDIFSYYTKSNLSRILRDIPAADVAQVVHGQWKYHKYIDKYECMACGHFVKAGTGRNYCPNCGSKMDKEADGGA